MVLTDVATLVLTRKTPASNTCVCNRSTGDGYRRESFPEVINYGLQDGASLIRISPNNLDHPLSYNSCGNVSIPKSALVNPRIAGAT